MFSGSGKECEAVLMAGMQVNDYAEKRNGIIWRDYIKN